MSELSIEERLAALVSARDLGTTWLSYHPAVVAMMRCRCGLPVQTHVKANGQTVVRKQCTRCIVRARAYRMLKRARRLR